MLKQKSFKPNSNIYREPHKKIDSILKEDVRQLYDQAQKHFENYNINGIKKCLKEINEIILFAYNKRNRISTNSLMISCEDGFFFDNQNNLIGKGSSENKTGLKNNNYIIISNEEIAYGSDFEHIDKTKSKLSYAMEVMINEFESYLKKNPVDGERIPEIYNKYKGIHKATTGNYTKVLAI